MQVSMECRCVVQRPQACQEAGYGPPEVPGGTSVTQQDSLRLFGLP